MIRRQPPKLATYLGLMRLIFRVYVLARFNPLKHSLQPPVSHKDKDERKRDEPPGKP